MPKMYRVLCGDRAIIIVVVFFGPPGEKKVCDGSVAFLLELMYCFDLLCLLVDKYFLAPVLVEECVWDECFVDAFDFVDLVI